MVGTPRSGLRWATALASPPSVGGLGLDPTRDIVGIFSHNCLDYAALANAVLVITVPYALLSAFSTPFELAHALRTSKATHIFVQPSLLPNALAAAKEVGLPDSSIHILEGQAAGRRSFREITDNVKRRGVQRLAVKPATKSTLAYLLFSSGTTGLPKAVMISHGNIWATILSNATAKAVDDKWLNVQPPTEIPVSLISVPLYHAYGNVLVILRVFSRPVTCVILPKWNLNLALETLARYRITAMPLVPSLMLQLVNHPSADLSSLTTVFTGTAYSPPSLLSAFKKRATKTSHVQEGYGASEMTLSICRKFAPGSMGLTVPTTSSGVLSASVEGRIVRPDGTDADYEEPGELWVRGPNMALGYFNNEQATRETFVDGWVRTGDTFKADKQGFLYFIDRAKDTLKIGGAQVSPTEIENVLLAQPDGLITDVCVAGVSGGRTSDEKVPRAWIVLSDAGKRRGMDETMRVLDVWARKNLSKYKWLRGGMEVTDEIPKNPTGKVLRRILQDRFEKTKGAVKSKL